MRQSDPAINVAGCPYLNIIDVHCAGGGGRDGKQGASRGRISTLNNITTMLR